MMEELQDIWNAAQMQMQASQVQLTAKLDAVLVALAGK